MAINNICTITFNYDWHDFNYALAMEENYSGHTCSQMQLCESKAGKKLSV